MTNIIIDTECDHRCTEPESLNNKKTDLYRGVKFDSKTMEEYISNEGEYINMSGFVSTSTDINEALVYATANI